MTKNQIHQRARELLENCLSKVPSLRIVTYEGAPWFDHLNQDFIVRVFVQDLSQLLLVAVIPSGQPRVARNALNLIARFRSEYPNSYGILIAPFVSSRTAEICKQNGAGYLDSAGNCFLSFQTIFIQREGLPNPAPARRELRSLYAPKSTRVLRVLLANARQSWRYQRLAREANVSLGQVANVLRILRDREWLTDEDSGVKLAAPAELLAEWTASYNFKKNVATDYYSLESPVEIEKTLGSILNDRGIRYALTGFSGAARVSPAVRYQRVMAFVEAMPEDALARLKLKPVDSGANVTILSPYDEGVFYGAETVDDLQVVHPIQLYLDLRNFKGRGEEAAAAILGDIILPSWRI
ncbi:MAG TPA: type IV toxin-antitoxin system AbiEi family antitoxin [Acidobacteriota bacterium]|nr:type IV toxin-antitoxin system AbiEi family antitoxin [Acidobacteriota bacterium]